jgi:glutathione S-transferase
VQDKIKIVAIDLADRPAWYKEKVYPGNKVPSLEHNNQVKGESLDLVKYIDSNFDGPALLPDVCIFKYSTIMNATLVKWPHANF